MITPIVITDFNVSCIYKILSPNGRIYIGKTINLKRRLYSHNSNYNRFLKGKGYNSLLFRSFNKYGKEKHILEIVEFCKPEALSDREIYYIDFYQSQETGLNLTKGGEGVVGRVVSIETRQKISNANKGQVPYTKGKHLTEEHKTKITNAHKQKTLPKEIIEQRSKRMKEFLLNRIIDDTYRKKFCKELYQYDINKNLIQITTTVDLCKEGFRKDCIQKVIQGIRNSYKGFIFSRHPL